MTHEELRDARDRQIIIAPPFALGGYTRFLQALRAVVELHTPEQEVGGLHDVNGDELWVCMHCSDGDGHRNYSCPTIQAIEKELS